MRLRRRRTTQCLPAPPLSSGSGSHGVMLVTFEGEGEGEIEIATAGETVRRLDPDSPPSGGWVEVVTASGKQGNVPESYVEWGAVQLPPIVPAATPEPVPQDWVGSLSTQAATAMHDLHAVAAAAGAPALPPEDEVDEDQWMADARAKLDAAGAKPRRLIIVLDDYEGEGDVYLAVTAGEKVWLCDGANVPDGWLIVEKHDGKGQADQRGLVPETFVSFDVEEEERAIARQEEKSAATPVKEDLTPRSLLTDLMQKEESLPVAEPVDNPSSDWKVLARTLIIEADSAPRMAAVALGDYEAQTDLDLGVSEGEKLWLCQGAEAPETWVIAEKKAGKGDLNHRGLVPETFVQVETEAENEEAPLDEQAQWMADAKGMIEAADTAPRKAAIALGDYEGETELDLAVSEGEKLWLCEAQAPETWVIAEKKAGKGDIDYRGLVPETFVSIDADEDSTPTAAVMPQASPPALDEQAQWLADAKAMLEAAEVAVRKAAIALGDFQGETEGEILR